MPVRIGKVSPAIPLAAALAVLLSAVVAGFIHARSRLTKLFLGFCCCCVHGNLHSSKNEAAGKRTSGYVPPRPLCSRRCKQYTPVHLKSRPCCAPFRRRKESSRAQIAPSWDRIG